MVQRVFQLVNASAEEVKATLEGTLARDLTPAGSAPPQVNVPVSTSDANGNPQVVTLPVGQTGTDQGPSGQGTGATGGQPKANGATIIADKRTNTLIVRGTAEQVAQVAELVPQLDQVVPQINVQVRIQEITEDASRSLGLDWKVGFGGFNVSVGGSGLGASFDPTRSLVGFNIFPTLTALENQGLTKRVYDGNITMQSGQRSLGSTTATQNASSTAAASIKSGGRLEINIPSQAANVAAIQKQIDYGLNLDFFDPQVAPDGNVTLRVRGQVNNLAGALPTTDLPTLLNFTNSEAQSTITFKSGQTVLMSGLLGTTESKTTTGVPFLSSLPVIGAAFGKQSTTRTQTQLLVIITGSVVK
jgi:type IV pilus assembly protein PilQ